MKSRAEKQSEKKDTGVRDGRKAANPYVFPMICGSGR